MISKDAPWDVSWIPPPPGYHRVPGRRPSEECSRQRGKKPEFYRSSQPDLLPAAVNQRSCVMAKHTSTGCLRSLTQPPLHSHPKTQGRKSMLGQICAQILTKAPVHQLASYFLPPTSVSQMSCWRINNLLCPLDPLERASSSHHTPAGSGPWLVHPEGAWGPQKVAGRRILRICWSDGAEGWRRFGKLWPSACWLHSASHCRAGGPRRREMDGTRCVQMLLSSCTGIHAALI